MRGNINKRYLKRRKNWFERNIGLFIVIIILLVIACVGTIFCINIFGKSNNVDTDVSISNQANGVQNLSTKSVDWIINEEPNTKKVSYTVPTNVQYPYYVKVNRALCCVTVYGIDNSGAYTIPVIAFACSVGKVGDETIVGENYSTTDKYPWRLMVDNSYAQNAFRIDGGYLFHSVPYTIMSNDSLETAQFNLLGSPASLGCVRLKMSDVKWIYDNCPAGTKVTIYDDATTPGPLGKPDTIKIPLNSPNAGWDPTDSNVNNPWLKCSAKIEGAVDITTKVGQKVDIMAGVKAKDTCGNDITSKLITVGKYTFQETGVYPIKYEVTDAIGSKAEVTVNLHVN